MSIGRRIAPFGRAVEWSSPSGSPNRIGTGAWSPCAPPRPARLPPAPRAAMPARARRRGPREEHVGQMKGALIGVAGQRDPDVPSRGVLGGVVEAQPVAQHDVTDVLPLLLSTWGMGDDETRHWRTGACARSTDRRRSRPLARQGGAACEARKLYLAAAARADETLDRPQHRTLEVVASCHLAGELDRFPGEQRDRPTAAQARVAACHQVVGALRVPYQVENGMRDPVGAFGEQDPPHPRAPQAASSRRISSAE